MTMQEYMRLHPQTEEQKAQEERDRAQRRADLEATQQRREAAQGALSAKDDKEPTKEEKAAAGRIYAQVCEGLKRGESPAALLILSLQALALYTKAPAGQIDKQREQLQTICGYALGDPGAAGTEIAEIESRLELLDKAAKDPATTYTQKKLIDTALRANRKRLKALQEQTQSAFL